MSKIEHYNLENLRRVRLLLYGLPESVANKVADRYKLDKRQPESIRNFERV